MTANPTPTCCSAEQHVVNTSCCADFYSTDVVRTLLGDTFHPGGKDLSARLVGSLELDAGSHVLDIACGLGTTAMSIAAEIGATVVGIDASERNIATANDEATARGLNDRVRFAMEDAAALPFEDAAFDAVICECAVSTFADKAPVVAEMVRVLKPGGVLGISDMALAGPLPQDVAAVVAPWTCLADARSVAGYQRLFLDAGLTVVAWDDEREALVQLAVELKRKLVLAGLGRLSGMMAELPGDIGVLRALLDKGRALIADGTVSYMRLVALKGARRSASNTTIEAEVARKEVAATAGCDPTKGCC